MWFELGHIVKSIGKQYLGVDVSADFVKHCNRNGLEVVQSDWQAFLQNCNQRFDAIFCIQFLEHLVWKDIIICLLKQSYRCMNLNGKLIVEFPNITSHFVSSNVFHQDLTHVTHINRVLFRTMAEFLGFVVEKEMSHSPAPGLYLGAGMRKHKRILVA